jgi:hypothetical protein
MSAEPPRPPPQSTIHAVGALAHDVVNGLKSSPSMLALIVLQLVVLAVVLYSSLQRQQANTEQFNNLTKLLEQCMSGKQ